MGTLSDLFKNKAGKLFYGLPVLRKSRFYIRKGV
jgi:hypothetical protein